MERVLDWTPQPPYTAEQLLQVIRILRDPENGCPWDKVQTHASIRKNFLEETCEALEAIDADDAVLLREELGDVLMQVVFHAAIEEERGRFTFEDVCRNVCEKLVFRHPNIFASSAAENAGINGWDALKNKEKGRTTLADELATVPATLPALMRAQKLQKRAAGHGLGQQDAAAAQHQLEAAVQDGLSSLKDNNQDMFQVTPGKVREGLPMLRAEIRLIGKEGLTGADRDAQLAAFRGLILDTNRQNFFIKVSSGKEIHMKGYKPTSAYKAEYDELVANDATLDKAVYYSNTSGSTWGVKMPVGARHAYETVPFKVAYTGFADWVNTNGKSNKNWYEGFDPEKTVRYW